MKATIQQNRELVPRYFSMTLTGMGDAARGEPGQFLMVRGDWTTDPLLGRPLSICRFHPGEGQIRIIYRIAGKGTLRLSEMKAGQTVDVTGPLGRPFVRPGGARRVILVAGAIGAPPLIALAESMETRPLLVIGGKTEIDVAFIADEIHDLGIETVRVTEDESCGERGTAVSALGRRVTKGDLVYACGPNPMLAEIARLSVEIGFEAYVSLEQRMACGIGVCLGCAVRHSDGRYVHVCKDGPVFNVTDIDWESL
jgi:dihydroorotate dehydrogenase electron transfer subunit